MPLDHLNDVRDIRPGAVAVGKGDANKGVSGALAVFICAGEECLAVADGGNEDWKCGLRGNLWYDISGNHDSLLRLSG